MSNILAAEAASLLDTKGWSVSWHWERDYSVAWRPVTKKGWHDIVDQLRREMDSSIIRTNDLMVVLRQAEVHLESLVDDETPPVDEVDELCEQIDKEGRTYLDDRSDE